jgi:dipeptidyl aminopeptidase/acylaminoacyl peptidase
MKKSMGLADNVCVLIDISIQACLPFYGPQDLTYRYNQNPRSEAAQKWLTGVVLHESPQQNPALWELVSPLAHINDNTPPYMILHGDNDSVVPVRDSQVFVEKLREDSNNPVVYAELAGAHHALDWINSIRTRHAVNSVHRFLEWARVHHPTNI